MTSKNYIFTLLLVGLSIFFARGQQIANYISNGGFEQYYNCSITTTFFPATSWRWIDSTLYGNAIYANVCYPNVPYEGGNFQYPRTGNAFAGLTALCQPTFCSANNSRGYLRNRLKSNLQSGKVYCVKFYLNLLNTSNYGIDGFGVFFGDNTLDTINYTNKPLTYLTPQIQNASNNIITDTLNWTLVTGTFVASGNEEHAVFGNFKSDAATTKTLLSGTDPWVVCEFYIDDVSCIPIDLSAYAGPDAFCIPGNSVYIGRQQDAGIDEACMWYKLPNMTTAIDTAAGTWVTPTSPTTTYVVKQNICGVIKYDTVVVFQSGVGFNNFQIYSDNINLSPNPTSDNLNVFFPQGISRFSITNSLGQIVRQEGLVPNINQISLQTSDLSNGLYQIHFKTSFGTVTKKFVKTD